MFRCFPRQRALFLAALITSSWAFLLSLYCYTAEYIGFQSFLFLDFRSGAGKVSRTTGYQFLMNYTFVVSVLLLWLSLAVYRAHRVFALFGCAASVILFVWAAVLPRY